jgi:5-methylcytosine-specific restriction endonuclease McrBC regulatory subunit McrC
MTVVSLKEHSKDASEPLTLQQEDFDWIDNENKEEEKVHNQKKLEIIHSADHKVKLKAKGYVGAISLPSGIIINIEPKTQKNSWENLFKLFEYTEDIETKYDGRSVNAEKGDSLWDIFAEIFTKKIMHLINSGLYRRYITKTEEITAIRGRLLVTQNIRSPQQFRTKHWCEFDELSYDVLENQLVLYCASLLIRKIKNTKTKQKLIKIKNIIQSQDVTLKTKFSISDAKTIPINRMNKKYEPIITYCKLILENSAYKKFSDTGEIEIPSFTISMWKLFENFIAKALRQHPNKKINVKLKEKSENILEPIADYPNKKQYAAKTPKLEPDHTLKMNNKKLILDTKWKEKVSSNDWYQMITYALAFKSDIVLVLPKFNKDYSDGFKIPKEFAKNNLTIHVKTIDFEQASESNDFIGDLKSQILEIVDGIEFKKDLEKNSSEIITTI